MTAASLPQFKAVHNEWNIECKVRKKAQTTIWRQNIISQNMQAVLLTVKKGSRKRHNDLETNYDYDMQAVLSTVKKLLIMGIVQREFIPSFPVIIWHLAPILHHFMKMILQQRQRFCKIEITKVWVGGLGEEGTRIELEVAFEEIGPVKNIWLAKNPPSFAFIEMEVRDLQEMQSIIEYYQVLSSIFKYDHQADFVAGPA